MAKNAGTRDNKQKNRKTQLRFLSIIFACAILLMSVPQAAIAAQTDSSIQVKTVVKVGWYESACFQEGMSDGNVEKSGYSYEYLQKIADYTGWQYEYVYGDWPELLEKLERGDIDLMAGLSITPEREKKMLFPDYKMGTENYCIYQLAGGELKVSDFGTFRHKKIGAIKNNLMTTYLEEWIAKNSIQANVIYFDGFAERDQALENHKIDAIVGADNNILADSGYAYVTQVGSEDYYLAVSKLRLDLCEQLNKALQIICEMDTFFLQNLQNSNYGSALSRRSLTSDEEKWLENHSQLKVGYMNAYLPYCHTDNKGNAYGLMTEVLDAILERLNISDRVQVIYESYEDYGQMQQALKDGEVDLIFPVGGGVWNIEQEGINISSTVISTDMSLVYRGSYSAGKLEKIAINKNNRLQYYYAIKNYPEAEIVLYNSIEACLNAVKKGEVGATFLDGLRTNIVQQQAAYTDLAMIHLPNDADRAFGVRNENTSLLLLINRGLSVIGQSYGLNAAYNYLEEFYIVSWLDVFRRYAWYLFAAALFILAGIIVLMIRYLRKEKRVQEEKQAQIEEITLLNRGLEKGYSIIQSMSKVYFTSFIVDLDTDTFEEMRTIDNVRNNVGASGNAQAALYVLCDKMVDPKTADRLREFADLSTIRERLADRDFVTCDYIGNTTGWSQLYIIAGTRDESGRLQTVFVTSRLIHEEKKREEEQNKNLADALEAAQHANRAKTVFLNNMSHDIRTPMNAIIGFTALAGSHIDNKEAVLDYLSKISVSSQHLLSLINDVLDMSRIESGKVKIEENEVHLPDVLHDLRTIVQSGISAKRLELFVDIQDVVHEDIITDRLRLNQVMLNILSNAIKFTPAGGMVSVRVTEKPAQNEEYTNFEFCIKDSGIGMSPEFKEHIFESFTREQTSTVSGIQGTGLGMAITKNIVDMLGGTIVVESEQGKGTEFIVNLTFQISGKKLVSEKIPELQGMRALVADDDLNTCTSVTKMLETIGMRGEWTASGKEAVFRAKYALDQGDEYQAYIIDLQMPDMNGIEVVRRIRKEIGDSKPIVILTAYDWADYEKEAKEAGVTGFCSKPLFMSELRSILEAPFVKKEVKEKEQISFTGKKILLVEDNALNREIATTILEEAGFVIESCEDGSIAVEKMKEMAANSYDLILMDIQMPIMDGYEATRQIRALSDEKKASIPIIAMTANAFEEDREKAFVAGMNGHIAKPIDIDNLMKELAKEFAIS